jgi:hypothetical protein
MDRKGELGKLTPTPSMVSKIAPVYLAAHF